MIVLQQLINGLQLGSVYALIALGYSMVYGIILLLNFAHGDIIMVGGYIALLIIAAGISPLVAVIASVAGCTVLACLIEKAAYTPLRSAPRISLLITAIGVSYFLQNAAQLIFGPNPVQFPSIVKMGNISLLDGKLLIKSISIVTILCGVAIMLVLTWFTGKTRTGRAMRAVSEDKGAAQLMGINVNRTISITFAIGSALAAIAGVLLCSSYPTLMPTTGSMPGIKAFTAAVFGGIGSIPGAMLGGVLLGLIEIFGKAYISSELGDAIVFAVLIVVLLFKPTGLLGKQIREKV